MRLRGIEPNGDARLSLPSDCFLLGIQTQRAGIWVTVEAGHVRFFHRNRTAKGEPELLDYAVRLETTPCHSGGDRHWFLCPGDGCGRRVAKLSFGGRYYLCRQCLSLAYPNQNEATYDRLARRANNLRECLGWNPGIFEGPGKKPKRMHWRTFEKLSAGALKASKDAIAEAERHFRGSERLLRARRSGAGANPWHMP